MPTYPLEKLWALELFRRELKGLGKQRAALAEEREERERLRQQADQKHNELHERKLRLAIDQQKLEMDVEKLTTRQQKHRNQLLSASNNREYSTLLSEIKHDGERQRTVEERILEPMEQREEVAGEFERSEEELSVINSQGEQREKETAAEEQRLSEEADLKQRGLAKLVAQLDDNTARFYRRIHDTGRPICAELRERACSVCGVELPSQAVSEVLNGKARQCESCAAMLVDPESASQGRAIIRNLEKS
ncbi:hypothetical protein K8R78_05520 [bacterium]|nr:hypothetical protein [bacterium]